jgi:hypothetical protein
MRQLPRHSVRSSRGEGDIEVSKPPMMLLTKAFFAQDKGLRGGAVEQCITLESKKADSIERGSVSSVLRAEQGRKVIRAFIHTAG